MSWCDPGEYASSSPECRIGAFHCAGKDAVVCVPIDCPDNNRYRSAVLHADHDPCLGQCGDRGHCDHEEQRCVCDKGWAGEHCTEFNDPCSSPLAQCGEHGRCVNVPSESGDGMTAVCDCDKGWMGRTCSTPTRCLPNGVWMSSARRCSCFEGWEGAECRQCNPDFLCVPTKDRERPFALLFVPKEQQENFLHVTDEFDGYAARHPIRPNSTYHDQYYDCACQAASSSASAATKSNLMESMIYYDDDLGMYYRHFDPYHESSQPYHAQYAHDYYDYYHYSPGNALASLILWVILLGCLLWFWWRWQCCVPPSPPPPPVVVAPKRRCSPPVCRTTAPAPQWRALSVASARDLEHGDDVSAKSFLMVGDQMMNYNNDDDDDGLDSDPEDQSKPTIVLSQF